MSLVLAQADGESWTPRQTLDLEEKFKESALFCPAEFRDERISAVQEVLRPDEMLDLSDLRPQPEGTTALVPTRERSSRSAAGQTASRVAPDVPVADHPLVSLRPAGSAGPPARRYELIYRNYAPTGPPAEMSGPPVPLPAHTVLLRVALFDKKVKRQEWIVHGKQTLLEVRPAHPPLCSSCAHSPSSRCHSCATSSTAWYRPSSSSRGSCSRSMAQLSNTSGRKRAPDWGLAASAASDPPPPPAPPAPPRVRPELPGSAGSAGAPVGPRPRRPCRLPPPGCSCLLIARSSTSREASTRAGLSVCLGLGSGSGLGLGLGLGPYLEGGFYTSGPLTLTGARTRTSRRLECGPARVAASARRGAARAASHGGGHLRDAPAAPRSAPP